MHAIFPSLRGIQWGDTKLQTIKATDLQPFPNLILLELRYNLLRHLDGDLFKYNPLLQRLDLTGNFISTIGPGIFNGLTQLKFVVFFDNIFTGMIQISDPINPDYPVADLQAYLEHLCLPLEMPNSNINCSENCNTLFDAVEAEVFDVEPRLTAPWYEKLKWFFKTVFGL